MPASLQRSLDTLLETIATERVPVADAYLPTRDCVRDASDPPGQVVRELALLLVAALVVLAVLVPVCALS
jgi:hypothetical protein